MTDGEPSLYTLGKLCVVAWVLSQLWQPTPFKRLAKRLSRTVAWALRGVPSFLKFHRSTDNNLNTLHLTPDVREAPYYSVRGPRRPSSRHDLSVRPQSAHASLRTGLQQSHHDPLTNDALVVPVESQSRPGSPDDVVGVSDIVNTDHGFAIRLDVRNFTPEEIKVTLAETMLTVSGKRSDLQEFSDGSMLKEHRRMFNRKYALGKDTNLASVRSQLNNDGILEITGERYGWKETNIMAHPPSYKELESRRSRSSQFYRGSGRESIISNV